MKEKIYYIGVMLGMVVVNSVQIGKGVRNKLINCVQTVVHLGIVAYYFYVNDLGEVSPEFYFWSTISLIFAFALEIVAYFLQGEKTVKDFLAMVAYFGVLLWAIGLLTIFR